MGMNRMHSVPSHVFGANKQYYIKGKAPVDIGLSVLIAFGGSSSLIVLNY